MSKAKNVPTKGNWLLLIVIVTLCIVVPSIIIWGRESTEKRDAMANAECNESTIGQQRYVDGCYQTCDGNNWIEREGCKSDTQIVSCNLYYANSELNGPTNITQTLVDRSWEPRSTATEYEETAHAENRCTFRCVDWYDRDATKKECRSTVIEPGMPCAWAPDIMITNGITSFTIMACNLWSSVVGTGSESYGDYFQWGNNYGFSSDPSAILTTSPTQVNASIYGPNNPYSSWTFITRQYRDSSDNRNLRGGEGDTTSSNGAGTHTDRRWPCPEGYHIPSVLEWKQLFDLGESLWYRSSSNGEERRDRLFLPVAGWCDYFYATVDYQDIYGLYWSSSPFADVYSAYDLGFDASNVLSQNINSRSDAHSVRCLKNSL